GTLQQAYVDLWANPVPAMMAAIQQAADDNIIPYKLWANHASIQAQLQKLKQAPPGATTTLPPIYQQLGGAGLTADQSLAVLESYRPGAADDDFWTGLAADPNFQGPAGTAALNKVKLVLQLSDWTANNTGAVNAIIQQHKLATPDDLRQLVTY